MFILKWKTNLIQKKKKIANLFVHFLFILFMLRVSVLWLGSEDKLKIKINFVT